jgi:endonuclease/exonuclease/phosphatase (EEP) superfamily protein YafD
LLFWICLHFLLGDRWWWLFAINSVALYLFVPAPFLLLLALALRKAAFFAGFLVAAVVWFHFWGALFMPSSSEGHEGPSLRVMSYNLLGFSSNPEAVITAIRAGQADVVGLQELNPLIADVIRTELVEEYPFQSLNPQNGVHGYGLISRLPYTESQDAIPDEAWVSEATIIEIDLDGTSVTLVRFHAASGPTWHREREAQARKLAKYAEHHARPLVLFGDLNATSTNVAYSLIANSLTDSWQEKGRGFGHTFPGAAKSETPGSSRPAILGVSVPKWLIRIDYVFHSTHWQVVSAHTGRFDGASDHRSVVVELELRQR